MNHLGVPSESPAARHAYVRAVEGHGRLGVHDIVDY